MRSHRQQNAATVSERSERRQSRLQMPSRVVEMRRGIGQMFSGESRVRRRTADVEIIEPALESPKTPRLVLGQNFSTTRLAIPYINRPSMSLPSSPVLPHSPRVAAIPTRPSPALAQGPLPALPRAPRAQTSRPERSRGRRESSRREEVGVDPADAHLAELADLGRRRRKGRSNNKERRCGLKFKHRRIRSKALSCMISGLMLILILTIYLGLALSDRGGSQEFHVLLILFILIITIFFCHSLIRLCMLLLHPPTRENDLERQNLPAMIGPGGYANPVVPIRVVLARDEEAAGIESNATKAPPPVYGLWRESVRVDPNRLFWQRNEAALERITSNDRPGTANRPPSYISDDGIDYVIEAVPRSIAPSNEGQLPVHPSERGRLYSQRR